MSKKPWSAEQLEWARRVVDESGASASGGYARIAKAFGITAEAARSRLLRARQAAPAPAVPAKTTAVYVPDFVKAARKGATIEELADRFELPPRKVRELIDTAKASGYRLDVAGHEVGYVPRAATAAPATSPYSVIAQPGEEHVFAVASDLHIGSKYCLEAQLIDFIRRAYLEDDVRTVFLPGDIMNGMYRHSRWEEKCHGFEAQAEHVAKVLPQLEGLRYVGIAGNHDETFEKDSGLDVCRALEDVFRRAGRSDLSMVGARGAYVRFAPRGGRGALVELWHPLGGGSYAVSYKLQRHVEEYGVGQKPDFVFAGHWHQQCYVVRRGVHCFLAGTFNGGGSAFGKALGGAQAIGGWIVRFQQTADGTIRDVQPTWRAYYEKETIREEGLT